MVKKYNILNTFVNNIDLPTLNNFIIESINKNKKIIVGNLNINAANLAYDGKALKPFNDKAEVVFCDGSGIKLACLIKGYHPIPEKITYNTWFPTLLNKCSNNGKKIFVLGSDEEVNSRAIEIFRKKYPELKIRGHHGFFEKSGIENEDIINIINKEKADFSKF